MKLNKKYLMALSGVAMLTLVATTGCGKKDAPADNGANTATEAPADNAANDDTATGLVDGTYSKVADEADNMGFTYEMTMEVKDGAIVSVNYDATNADGKKKSEMSLNGEYVMTEDGPTWAEQAESLVNYLIENQSLSELTVNEEGKTDAISGVSINISGFIAFAEDCLSQAAAK